MVTTVPNNVVAMNMCSIYRNYVNSNVPWGLDIGKYVKCLTSGK